jgi:DNA modification methylase
MARVRWQSKHVEIWHGDAREVAAQQEPGSFSLAILDGPYGCGKSKVWDRMKVRDLPDWYAPHLDDVGRLCGDSATLYLWNTAEGWATLHPGIVARGWVFRSLVVWDKNCASLGAIAGGVNTWPRATEVCGVYAVGGPTHEHEPGMTNVWRLHPNQYDEEKPRTGKVLLVTSKVSGETTRREPLHPCQKPLAFAERMVRASTRPGGRVWAPFGGTCREAVAVETMARKDPAEARYCVTAEIDEDGRGYLDAVCRQLDGHGIAPPDPRQPALF